ncbi:alpha/beta fold hydrolase [Thetidibacter halocola]|uniref:Alpha/beta hydrolase n=1 Tax=Thetidibacter halocola TaxID=2827239 RepID=A0A8J8B744_9RHOB|nr:alpha/beta fold hydrolase [Thetidibacter halocola]MBS0123180.1 alpha/beta hydrolase [Thetidibacter halocola]
MRHAFADCLLDTETLTLTRAGTPVPVEPQVFDLLRLLVENAGRVVTRDEIVETVWKGRIVSESAISARIAAARKAVGCDGKTQAVIRTVARRGLQLTVPVSEQSEPPAALPVAPQPALQRIRYCRTPEGHRIAYALSGSGPPVIRSNPVVASNVEAELKIDALRDFFGAISAHNTLLRFDAVGVGCSDREGARIDLDGLTQQIGLVADAAGMDRFALYAESGGTHRAIAYAAQNPERVSRLVLVGGYVDGRLRRGGFDGPEPIRAMIEQGWDTPRGGLAAGYLLSYFPDGPLETVRAWVDMMQTSTPKAFALAKREWVNNGSIAEYLSRVRCPTLVVHARHDAVHPLSEAQKLAAGIAQAELVVLDSGNHMPLPGTPVYEPFLETLLAFLAEDDIGGAV